MIKVLQYGQGNFLRTFVEPYFDQLNQEGGAYSVTAVTAIPHESLEAFQRQEFRYHIILRGSQGGKPVEEVREICSLNRVIDPFLDPESYDALALDPELKLIVSNTTEAGICFQPEDRFDQFESMAFPGKLTKFLLKRWQAGQPGLCLLPVELIDDNAGELKRCVEQYIALWELPQDFARWVQEENSFCATLVDRIVSGYPRDPETRRHLTELLGEEDALMAVGEPFGLWVVEKKGPVAQYLPEGRHHIDVVLTPDIRYYKRRKVRVLNGSHTNLAPAGLWEGQTTVDGCMKDSRLRAFLLDTLDREIVPFVSQDVEATREFAASVLDRFENPYLNHQLTSILLNSISKWRARDLPSFRDFYKAHGRIPENLTKGFAYLVQLYCCTRQRETGNAAQLPGREIPIQDEERYLTYFQRGGTVESFLKDASIWGEDLTGYDQFLPRVEEHLSVLEGGGTLL